MKKTILKGGLFRKANHNDERKGEFNLDVWIKRVFNNFGIAFVDPCCDVPDNVPVAIDSTTNRLKIWDNSIGQFETISNLVTNSIEVDSILKVNHVQAYGTEKTIKLYNPIRQDYTQSVAKNTTAVITAAELAGGRITSTSAAAAVTLTLPTATLLSPEIGASAGSRFQFIVDNSAGANTVTLDLTGTGITTGTSPITGGGTLTVSVANVIGLFELFFTSSTAAIIRRIA
jgi:hypothetical protein